MAEFYILIHTLCKGLTPLKSAQGMVSQIHRESDAARREQEERIHKMAALKKQARTASIT